ncbi:MAG TPA: Phenylacetic acid catabolic protein [Candidatus Polarisedimenticolia bacterium]|jgi:benzoyl-CoA 2,3-dioxygenase component B
MAPRINTFDDWVDCFHQWQKEIGFPAELLEGFKFDAKYGEVATEEIPFGDYKGEKRWKKVLEIPDQRIRDALQHLIVYQGDTEFGSVEQQRRLAESAPSDYDLQSLVRVMREEMRHGWQMCHLLVSHFGYSGRVDAQKQLERRSYKNTRLLNSFNVDVDNWLDFFVYTEFIDRDGKFQLRMLSHSGFAPLAASMGPMLKEEAFHLGTGHTGLKRIVKAGVIPLDTIQRYFNKWIPTAYDLFGVDSSSSAQWSYVWGLKGRFDEDTNPTPPDKTQLNDYARMLYREDIGNHVAALNNLLPADGPRLVIPDMKFNRAIGRHAGECWGFMGEAVSPDRYPQYLASALPTERDRGILADIFKEKNWIAPHISRPDLDAHRHA